MNTWVLLRELPELIEGAKEDGVRRAAATLQRNYSDSVDALVLTSEAEVIMHQPEMALPHRNRTQAYLTLLRRSLEAFGGKRRLNAEANPISLGRKWKEVSHTFRASGTDTPDYTLVEIDTTPFGCDGILHVKIRVGAGEATGTFELFDADTDLTRDGSRDETLTGAWDVPPGGIGHILHGFQRGDCFLLRATSLDSKAGSTNSFLADIYVTQEGENT